MIDEVVVKKFASLEKIVEACDEEEPEELVAEFLASIGLIERRNGGYQLTKSGRKFLNLPKEQ
jgi:hypothetical protein